MRIVAGRFRGKSLKTPTDHTIRPTSDRVRESVFNILANTFGPVFDEVRVLDLFAGTGALGFEALSRGAASAIFVDMGAEARGLIREHMIAFGVTGQSKLLRRDATDLGATGNMPPCNLVFCDPPYGQELGEKALASASTGRWIASGATIVLEERSDTEITLPEGFVLEDERQYGDTKIRFLTFSA